MWLGKLDSSREVYAKALGECSKSFSSGNVSWQATRSMPEMVASLIPANSWAMAQLMRKEYLCTSRDYGLIDLINILRR